MAIKLSKSASSSHHRNKPALFRASQHTGEHNALNPVKCGIVLVEIEIT